MAEKTKKKAAAKTAKAVKAAPAKKAEVKKAEPVKKVEAKKAAPAKKVEAVKAAPVKKVEAKKAAPVKKAEVKKAAPAKKVAPVKKEAEKQVTVAFIGCGIQAKTVLIPNIIKQKNAVVKAVCDCDKVRREAAAAQVNKYYKDNKKAKLATCSAVADFRDIINDPSISAVCIATPDHWHAYIAIAAMKAGKDVYCEKPLTYSIEEAQLIMKAEKKYNRIFQSGSMQRSWREFRTACMIVRNGFIGDVKYVDCNYGNASAQDNKDIAKFNANLGGPSHPHRFFCQWDAIAGKNQTVKAEAAPNDDVDWDMWLGPAPWSPYSDQCAPRGEAKFYPMFWRFDDNYGTGYNGDWGAHHLDIAQWGLDLDKSGPVKVICSKEAHSTNPLHGGRRQFGMQFVLENGTVINHTPFGIWGTVFYGTKGIVAVNRGCIAVWLGKGVKPTAAIRKAIAENKFDKMKCVAFCGGVKYGFDPTQKKDDSLTATLDTFDKYFDLANAKVQLYKSPLQEQNFIDCCISRETPISPAEVGARVSILCGLCNMSYVYDTGFDWDPVKCEFANGTGDPAWLKRAVYRKDWDIRKL